MTNSNSLIWLSKDMKDLFSTIAKLNTAEDTANFLRDVCTIQEIEAIAERWKVCKLLNEGKSYREINKLTGTSTTTITRVAYWLEHGCGGYRKALKKN